MRKIYLLSISFLLCLSVAGQVDAKFGKGIKFMSPDETFSMKFSLRIQPLFTTNFRDFEKFDQPALNEIQMMIRRARLKFDGHVYDKKWTYKFELAFGNRNIGGINEFTNMGARIILDAVIKYQFHKNYSVWFGQTKLPGNRERVVSSANLQFVDRHVVNSRFNLDRDMGFQLRGKHKVGNMPILTAFALSMGEGRNITETNLGGLEYTFRAEVLPLGAFSSKKGHYSEADLDREPKPKLSIGASYDFNDRAVRARGNQGSFILPNNTEGERIVYTNSLHTLWIDLIFKYKGWSFMSEYAQRSAEKSPLVFNEDDGSLYGSKFYTGNGINFQAGYLFKNNIELAGRTSFMRPEVGIANQYNQYTFVVSKYIVGHSLKVQSDISYSDYSAINGETVADPLMFRFQVEIGL
jgi:phosphate-selective porin OprO/OprP